MASKKKKVNKDTEKDVNEESFWYKFRSDKKYNAKVQLIGYGIFILVVIIGVNISGGTANRGSMVPSNRVGSENTSKDDTSLLEGSNVSYQYDVVMDVRYKNILDEEVSSNVSYSGKKYKDVMEITKKVDDESGLYYKNDSRYYSKTDNNLGFVKDDVIYDIVDADYIEIDNIIKLINKASLDHVTGYSSGRKEYVYNLKVRDLVVSYQMEDVIEFNVVEENSTLNISVDFSSLFKVIDKNILGCKIVYNVNRFNEVKEEEINFNNTGNDISASDGSEVVDES